MARPGQGWISGMLVALAVLSAACGKKEEAPPPPPPTVEVAPVTQKDVPVFAEWIGSLDGFVNAQIRPQIEGYVLRRNYQEGYLVKAGEALFEIDPRQFQATYDQAKGTLAQNEATLANAKTTAARYRPLAAEKAISQQELDDAETRERTAQANVESARASLEKAKLDLDWTKVVSPIDGIAGVAVSQVGDLVNHQVVMTTVSQVNPIKVYFNPERAGVPGLGRQARPGPEDARRPAESLEKGNARAHSLGRLGLPAPREAVPRRARGRREDRHDPARGSVPEPGQPAAARPVRQGPCLRRPPEGSDPRPSAGRSASCREATRSRSSVPTTR